ncbi:O-antigen ligase [Herbaspirillum sp. YR522]|uniref:O-antigen ligase family protein n=1 Tax=Herbaspirillum sp. YR522 TaxID=1144342 RepID=UPI00026F767F|nr:O-antigen ligase family protein [Herbaspirillum sp. YR522]EJN08088.1 lipid A core-O-antigen ligase-like enyme [Herbaspirillum sp. YR522]
MPAAMNATGLAKAPTQDIPWKPFWVAMLVMSIVLFSGAWLFQPSTFGGVDTLQTDKIGGVPFQYLLWLMILLGLCLHIGRAGFDFLARVLLPWLPFFLAGLTASVFGISPFTSLRALVLWTFCILSAAIVVGELPVALSRKVLFRTTATLMVLSVLVSVAVPAIGQHANGGIWRGVFSNKNALGWIATLCMLVSAGMCTRQRWKFPAFVVALAILCILMSGSKGSLVAALVTLGYLGLVGFLRSRVTVALGVTTLLVSLLSILIFGFFVLPELLALLGKDPTFTGRTFVWSMYFNSMLNTPFLGEGPGAYTYLSELTLPLALRLSDLGAIVTPHNAFLGAFGDGGIVGLLAFAGVLIYLAMIAPFLRADRATLVCAGVAFFNMAHGMVETHEVFTTGFAWFLMVLLRGMALRDEQEKTGAKAASGHVVNALA